MALTALFTSKLNHLKEMLFSIFQHTHKWVTHLRDTAGFPFQTLFHSLFLCFAFYFILILYCPILVLLLSLLATLSLSLLLSSLQKLGLSQSICENKVPHQGITLTHEPHQKMMTQTCTDQKRFEVVWPLCVHECQLRFWCIASTPIRQK